MIFRECRRGGAWATRRGRMQYNQSTTTGREVVLKLPRSMKTAGLLAGLAAGLSAADPSYFRDVRPVLQRQCQGCHQPNLKSSDLDLTTYEGLAAGGKHGPGLPLIVKYLTGEMKPQMPLGQPPLAAGADRTRARLDRRRRARTTRPAEARETPPTSRSSTRSRPSSPRWHSRPTATRSPSRAIARCWCTRSTAARRRSRLAGLSERILSLAFSADGTLLVAGGGTPARFGEIQIWDAAAGNAAPLRGPHGRYGFRRFALARRVARRGGMHGQHGADRRDGHAARKLAKMGAHENWVLGSVFGVDGKRVVSVGRDRAAKLTDAVTGRIPRKRQSAARRAGGGGAASCERDRRDRRRRARSVHLHDGPARRS